jgi:riboflavin kinase/FMN adenylyltransferase
VSDLQEFGRIHRFSVVDRDLVSYEGAPVTSTRVRSLVAAGELELASVLLGRPHRVHGTVVRGRGDGAKLGFPTANIATIPYAAIPPAGVYAGRVVTGGSAFRAAVSVGAAPSYPESQDSVEVHLIGFEGDLYGRELCVEFVKRVRDHQKFDSVDLLAEKIRQDVAACAEAVAWED